MNYTLFHHDMFILSLFLIPTTLVIIKMIVHLVLWIKSRIVNTQLHKMRALFRDKFYDMKYEDAAIELKMDKKYKKLRAYDSPILDFIREHLVLDCCNFYTLFSILGGIIAGGIIIAMMCTSQSFNTQKEIYSDGNFTCITKYYNYKSLPQWDNDAYNVINNAEFTNRKFFTEKNNFKYSEYNYILKEEIKKIHPIDTNIMWDDFLSMYKNWKEVFQYL